MKKSWALKWASYLEKPHVRQAHECLMSGKDRRCCLGHAEVVAGKKFRRSRDGRYLVKDEAGETEKEDLLTDDTRYLFEMKSNNGQFETPIKAHHDGGVFTNLAEMNDARVPLKTIAQVIRKKYKEL
jgi:hypothetical protein